MRLTILATLAAAVLVGCGVSPDGAMDELAEQAPAPPVKAVTPIALTTTPGEVVVGGVGRGTLTPLAARLYLESGGPQSVELHRESAAPAFADLCAGKLDLVDSSRRISRSELEACRAAGLTPVQFQVASDAVVVATKSGVDVGADCATVNQIREMYRAGSPIYDWAQLRFADAPLHVSGPGPGSSLFRLFGEAVLGSEQPSLVDVRSDYHEAADADRRHFVAGQGADARLAAERPALAARLRGLRADARRAHASLRSASEELREAERQVDEGIADQRSLEAQARDAARVERAEQAISPARRWVARADAAVATAQNDVAAAADAARRVQALRGRVGNFRFSYYELFEDQLRPLEVDRGPSAGGACVFPSRQSVTDGTYPLSRHLLLTATTAGLRRAEVRSFLGSYLSNAQRMAARYQLVPLPDDAVRTQAAWARGTKPPADTAGMAGAGSVQ